MLNCTYSQMAGILEVIDESLIALLLQNESEEGLGGERGGEELTTGINEEKKKHSTL